MRVKFTTMVLGAVAVACTAFLMAVLGGVVVLATFVGAAVTLVAVPWLWFNGSRRAAGKVLAAWGVYSAFYLVVSTGIALLESRSVEPRALGQEVCADSGCFAVDKVDKTISGAETLYILSWRLASRDAQQTTRFPGKGLELYLFDERGRTFRLPETANPNPLDVTLAAGESVRQAMTFSVPADARELFLTARYRPFTFQSLLPGALSLVPHRPTAMIRIQ